MDVDSAPGAAMRRRQRRLRQFLRHERLSVAMALAEFTHHSALRRPALARARGEESEMNNATGQKTPPPRAASTVHFDLFDEGDVLAARPTPLVEVRPQLGVQRHSAEQVIETFVPVQVLDAEVPQVGEVQVVEFMREFDAPVVAEPVIEVPKISLDKVPRHRMVDLAHPPQTAEQLVHVPTIISYSSLQRAVEQTIDIPVPQARRGGGGGLQGFRAGQGTPAADVEQIVENPVPQRRRRRSGGLQSSLPGQGSTAYLEQIVDIPAREGLQGFLPGQGSSPWSRLHGGTDAGIQGVFRTFPREEKSAEQGPHSGSELGADFTPWTPAACDAPMVAESLSAEELEDLGIWVDEFGSWWSRSGVFPGRWVMHDTTDGPVWWDEPG